MSKKLLLPLAALAFFAPSLTINNLQVNAIHVTDYKTKDEYASHAIEIGTQIADEGTVLLKNNGFLPMKKNVKVSVFGKSSSNLSSFGGAASSEYLSTPYIRLHDSLEQADFVINPDLEAFYNNSNKSGKGRTNGNTGWTGVSQVTIGETPIENYSDSLKETFKEYSYAALMIITREGSEGCDIKTCDARDSNDSPFSNKHALELSDNEQALFNMLHEYFNHIIIVIDSATCFECDVFEKDAKVSGIIWTGGYSGQVGIGSLGKILNGSVNPSGRTVETWARDFTKDPTFKNFSDNSQTNLVTDTNGDRKYVPQDTMYTSTGDPVKSPGTKNAEITWADEINKVPTAGINGTKPSAFVKYEEDIYVDYRYYETLYEDKAIVNKQEADAWYGSDEGVVYPFGYGLSYTNFAQHITEVNFDKNKNRITTTVEVENTGKVDGKQVVQLYWKAPYTPGGIEKASEVLCAFGKTDNLRPGEKVKLDLSFNLQDVANYDALDANNNDFKGYEVEKGTYYISLRENAHTQCIYNGNPDLNTKEKIDIENDIKFDKDMYTGNEVKNRFTSDAFSFFNTLPTENDFKFTKLTRNGGIQVSTIGDNSVESRTLKAGSRIEEYLTHPFTIADVDVEHNYEYISEDVYVTKQQAIEKGFRQSKKTMSKDERTLVSDMVGVPFDDPKWKSFLNEFTYDELCGFVAGNMASPGLSSIGLARGMEGTGPNKYSYMVWPSCATLAATFNVRLAEEYGDCVGDEANISGKYGWWNVDANIRRSPFNGYAVYTYSSDPLLTGKIIASFVKTAKQKGVVTYVGYLGLGEQQKNREGGCMFASEQAIRELYLKGIQYVVQEGKTVGVTTAYQRLGLVEAANNYRLLNDILREEWGFNGVVLGEMTHSGNANISNDHFENINYRILAGQTDCIESISGAFKKLINCTWDSSAFDGNGAPVFTYNEQQYESYSWWNALRNRVKERLYVGINYTDVKGNNINSSDKISFSFNYSLNDSNTPKDRYIVSTDKELSINITADYPVDNSLENSVTIKIDSSTPLPRGLSLNKNVISGIPKTEGVYRINILVEVVNNNVTTIYGKRLVLEAKKYFITPAPEIVAPTEPSTENPDEEEEKGCKGSIISELPIMLLSVIGGVILLIVNRRRK